MAEFYKEPQFTIILQRMGWIMTILLAVINYVRAGPTAEEHHLDVMLKSETKNISCFKFILSNLKKWYQLIVGEIFIWSGIIFMDLKSCFLSVELQFLLLLFDVTNETRRKGF